MEDSIQYKCGTPVSLTVCYGVRLDDAARAVCIGGRISWAVTNGGREKKFYLLIKQNWTIQKRKAVNVQWGLQAEKLT